MTLTVCNWIWKQFFKNRVTDRVSGSDPVTRFQCWPVPHFQIPSGVTANGDLQQRTGELKCQVYSMAYELAATWRWPTFTQRTQSELSTVDYDYDLLSAQIRRAHCRRRRSLSIGRSRDCRKMMYSRWSLQIDGDFSSHRRQLMTSPLYAARSLQISPNSTWFVTSRRDERVEPCCSTCSTRPKCMGSTRSQLSSSCRACRARRDERSSRAVRQARHSENAWARHVERVESCWDVTWRPKWNLGLYTCTDVQRHSRRRKVPHWNPQGV